MSFPTETVLLAQLRGQLDPQNTPACRRDHGRKWALGQTAREISD